MGKENKVLTIDIGSRSLRMAEFIFQANGVVLTNFLSRRIERAENETIGEWFERNYNEMLIEGGFTAKHVRMALPSSNSFQRLSKLPAMLGNSSTVAKIIEFEAAQAVPYAMHEVEWGYQLLHHEWEETSEETNENGEVEEVAVKNEEYEALFVAVKNEDVVCYTDAVERSGKKLLSVELASINLFNAAVVSQIKEDECTMLLEIGARGSCLMLADHRRIFMRNIPIGGDTINTQISREFGVSDKEAEDLKRRHGFVALGGAYDEPESALAATISKIARNVMTRLHGEVSRSINVWRAQHNGNAPVKVLLAGGGATMQYTIEFFQEKLHVPVEYLNTFGLITISPAVDRAALQAAASMAQSMIGMALHSIGSCPVDISLLPRTIRKQYELDARKPYFYASAIALVSCLLISVVCINQISRFEQERVEKVEVEVERAKKEAASVMALKGKLDVLKSDYDHSAKFWDSRNQLGHILSIIQEDIPRDCVWLVAFEPYEDPEEMEEEVDEFDSYSSRPVQKTVSFENMSEDQRVDRFMNISAIKKIRMEGYFVKLKNIDSTSEENLLHDFANNKLKNRRDVFESVVLKDTPETDSNLTKFEIILTLKDELKK